MDVIKLVAQMSKRVLYDSIWKSSLIEGYKLTYRTVEDLLENQVVTATRNEVLFVVNMKRAWDLVYSTLGCSNNLPLLRQLNGLCGSSGLIYGSGDLRTVDVSITGCSYSPTIPVYADVLIDLMDLNSIKSPIHRAVCYFCYLAKKQLFIDGNKRMAQLLFNKILIESGVGYLMLSEEDVPVLMKYLCEYYETDNPENLMSLLRKSIVEVKEN